MTSVLPTPGTRLSHSGFLGTVRFVGPVDGTQGVWLGVEWDDPKRGKHDGVKDGKRYFTCLVPNSGSFIRPSPAICYGVTFLTALTAKYVESPLGALSSEKVVLGSSGGAIEVEAVGLDKIRGKLAQLERLREVSLDNECVSQADTPGELARKCPGIRGLDLSKNLISGWDVVSAITVELSGLRRLSLNQNRLRPPQYFCVAAFERLEELQLNATFTTWEEFQAIIPHMPALASVELGYNGLRSADKVQGHDTARWPKNSTIRSINLDGNELDQFADACARMHNLSALQRLVLTSNHITQIPSPSGDAGTAPAAVSGGSPVGALKHLALAFNRIASWSDIDALPCWCPQLESLTLAGNPLFNDPAHRSHARPYTIAKIPSLQILDGAAVSPKERRDSEILYLSYISKQALSEDEKRAAHPQYEPLCAKHGATDAPAPTTKGAQDTLGNRLIGVRIYLASGGPPPHSLPSEEVEEYLRGCRADVALRVLSTMSVRPLRLKAIKSLKIPKAQQSSMRLWMVMPDGHFVVIDEEYAGRDLSWWGVEEGTIFVLAASEA
ncbi:uncharacterized protein TRAVEDRAFT_164763 [Trametes versicolor FP-101664 SS1]|uniref:uncharacterized protein n=1 Tax=Trametes versicolor (strain FP-101664) TaxID=717944 RepID=UPI0004622E09|nr:uncharacterized protein TRAVEDRAFT_164763 [Trametes versicolor FP-101664 SS1]EIW60185.1 hypothetical protein TRAVEDRAFT_164763 [Trametes versicolor FP-101664 SS1]